MNQSVQKAIALLDLFIDDKELSLQDIAKMAAIPKPTAYRLLSTLEDGGFLYKIKDTPHDSRYGLGLKLLELGNMVSSRLEIREVALPYMEKLARELNEVVHLVIADQQEATYIEKVNSRRALSLQTYIGRSVPLYIGSGPKLLLAYRPKKEQREIIHQANRTLTNKPIDQDVLKEELEKIRENQYAISISEQDADTTGISFPIFNYKKKVVAALAISGISIRFEGKRLKIMKQHGRATSAEISRLLGYKNIKDDA